MIRLKTLPPGFHVIGDVGAGDFSFQDAQEQLRFGRLVPLSPVMGRGGWHKQPRKVIFQCDCGRRVILGIVGIRRRGVPDTCGKKCRLGPLTRRVYGTAPKSKQYRLTYDCWRSHKSQMCKRWKEFKWFLKDMGLKPDGLTLARRDRRLLHSPKNSLWDHHGADRSNVVVWGMKASIRWLSDRWCIPYFYIAKISWDSKTPVDMKEIVARYAKYQKKQQHQ